MERQATSGYHLIDRPLVRSVHNSIWEIPDKESPACRGRAFHLNNLGQIAGTTVDGTAFRYTSGASPSSDGFGMLWREARRALSIENFFFVGVLIVYFYMGNWSVLRFRLRRMAYEL